MIKMWKIINFIIIITLTSAEKMQLPTGWVNPNHQNYDRKTKTIKEAQFNNEDQINPVYKNYFENTDNFKSLHNYYNEQENIINENDNNNDILLILSYYRRVVNLILNNGIITSDDMDSYNLYLSTSINSEQYDILKKFGNDYDIELEKLRDVDMVLSKLLSKSMKQTFEDLSYRCILNIKMFLNSPLLYVFLVSCLIIIFTYILSKTSFSIMKTIGTVTLIIFGIGFIWTYIELIEEAELKQMSDRLQNSELPQDCNLNSMRWWEKIFFRETGNNCHKYIQANYKTAWKTVTPNKVLITMTGSSLSDILTYFGKSVINIIRETYNELPFPLNVILIIPMMTLILFLITIAFCSYCGFTFEISMLYNLFNLKYKTQNNARQIPPTYINLPQQLHHRTIIETIEADQIKKSIVTDKSDPMAICNCNLISKHDVSQNKGEKHIKNKNKNVECKLKVKNKKLLKNSDIVSIEPDINTEKDKCL